MPNISDTIGQYAADAAMWIINTAVSIKRGMMPGLETASRRMHYVYSLEGFEKWSKALGSDLKFLNALPMFKGIFDDAIRAAEDQKNLYYATLIIGSMCDFIKRDMKTEHLALKCQRSESRNADGDLEEPSRLGQVFLRYWKFFRNGEILSEIQNLRHVIFYPFVKHIRGCESL